MNNDLPPETLESLLSPSCPQHPERAVKSPFFVAVVDTAANLTYSLVVGSALDYLSGLSVSGIVASRITATVTNTFTGPPYGWWREKLFEITRTREESTFVRKTLVDLIACNTFWTPVYAGIVAVGSLASDGKVDMEKVQNGAINITLLSPFISPTFNWYMDFCRMLFGINSAAKGAYITRVKDNDKEH